MPPLKKIIKVSHKGSFDGKVSKETMYYFSRKQCDEAPYFAKRIRDHWGIENKLPWHFDVNF